MTSDSEPRPDPVPQPEPEPREPVLSETVLSESVLAKLVLSESVLAKPVLSETTQSVVETEVTVRRIPRYSRFLIVGGGTRGGRHLHSHGVVPDRPLGRLRRAIRLFSDLRRSGGSGDRRGAGNCAG